MIEITRKVHYICKIQVTPQTQELPILPPNYTHQLLEDNIGDIVEI